MIIKRKCIQKCLLIKFKIFIIYSCEYFFTHYNILLLRSKFSFFQHIPQADWIRTTWRGRSYWQKFLLPFLMPFIKIQVHLYFYMYSFIIMMWNAFKNFLSDYVIFILYPGEYFLDHHLLLLLRTKFRFLQHILKADWIRTTYGGRSYWWKLFFAFLMPFI